MKEYIVTEHPCFPYGEPKPQELIRCKDCKYAKKIYLKNLPWLKLWEYSCQYFNTHSVMGDGYCNNAEREEE